MLQFRFNQVTMCILSLLKLHVPSGGLYGSLQSSCMKTYYRRNSIIYDEPTFDPYYKDCYERLNERENCDYKPSVYSELMLEDYLVDYPGFHQRFEEHGKRYGFFHKFNKIIARPLLLVVLTS